MESNDGHGVYGRKKRDGAALVVDYRIKELMIEWLGIMMFFPTRVVQDCLQLGKDTDRSFLVEQRFWRTTEEKPPLDESWMKPL